MDVLRCLKFGGRGLFIRGDYWEPEGGSNEEAFKGSHAMSFGCNYLFRMASFMNLVSPTSFRPLYYWRRYDRQP